MRKPAAIKLSVGGIFAHKFSGIREESPQNAQEGKQDGSTFNAYTRMHTRIKKVRLTGHRREQALHHVQATQQFSHAVISTAKGAERQIQRP